MGGLGEGGGVDGEFKCSTAIMNFYVFLENHFIKPGILDNIWGPTTSAERVTTFHFILSAGLVKILNRWCSTEINESIPKVNPLCSLLVCLFVCGISVTSGLLSMGSFQTAQGHAFLKFFYTAGIVTASMR